MIHISHLTKTFCSASALSNVNLEIPDNAIFGLLGTNGAGKSTLLRILAGILNADSGEIFIDGEKLTDTSKVRQMIFYLSDDQYYFPGATPQTMLFFYEKMYPGFDRERFLKLLSDFQLDSTKKLHTFSKGQKKRKINYLKAHQIPAQNTIENYMLVSAERFRILENGYRASEALYESEEDLTKLASQLVVRDFAVNPLLYPVNPSCEILLKTKDPSSGSILEADCALRK